MPLIQQIGEFFCNVLVRHLLMVIKRFPAQDVTSLRPSSTLQVRAETSSEAAALPNGYVQASSQRIAVRHLLTSLPLLSTARKL